MLVDRIILSDGTILVDGIIMVEWIGGNTVRLSTNGMLTGFSK
ncbi:MAG TPA: hypothetical protein VK974_09295 [Methylophilaceae bacterium]|nr:hypothetical protein [Methylophilaceae bacterium]